MKQQKTPSMSDPPEHLLSEQETAQLLNRSVQSLRRDRNNGIGPKWFRIGRSVKYRPRDVQTYIEARLGGGLAVFLALLSSG